VNGDDVRVGERSRGARITKQATMKKFPSRIRESTLRIR
jgi:hypothetical protein